MISTVPAAGADCWSGRRVAVTGASGFLGYHLATELVRRGARVTALLRAGSDRSRLSSAGVHCLTAPLDDVDAMTLAADGCELLFHLAGAVDFGGDWPRFQQTNVEGSLSVLAAARAARVRRVVHVSSIVAVGGSRGPLPLDESAEWNLGPRRVPYATTKREAEVLALQAARAGQDVVVVNPASAVGPEDFTSSMFGSFCRRFWGGRAPCHFGGGNNFVDVRDVADGMLRAAMRGRSRERYLLGGENRTYDELFEALCAVAGRRRFWMRLPRLAGTAIAALAVCRPGRSKSGPVLTPGQARLLGLYFFFDSTKARRELGFAPRPLAATLADTFEFWSEQRRAG
jgi:dihydroflavonol-4-reductase